MLTPDSNACPTAPPYPVPENVMHRTLASPISFAAASRIGAGSTNPGGNPCCATAVVPSTAATVSPASSRMISSALRRDERRRHYCRNANSSAPADFRLQNSDCRLTCRVHRVQMRYHRDHGRYGGYGIDLVSVSSAVFLRDLRGSAFVQGKR